MKRIALLVALLLIGPLLLAPLVLWILSATYIGGTSKGDIEYLSQHHFTIQRGANIKPSSFDTSFYSKEARLFLVGEIHGYADVQDLDFQIFTNLNKYAGVRNYLAELDSIRAGKLNTFLAGEVPDTILLRQIVKEIAFRIPQQSSKQLYDKWLRIHKYNSTLNQERRIAVYGIDTDYDDPNGNRLRDSAMFSNFCSLLDKTELKGEKFYGLFGFFHVLQGPIKGKISLPFAARLKENGRLPSNCIRSIVCLPLESNMYMPKGTVGYPDVPDQQLSWFNMDGPFFCIKGIKDLAKVGDPNKISIFRLDAAGSPYNSSQRLLGIKTFLMGEDVLPAHENMSTTDYYQYIALTRGSAALSALSPK